MKNRLIALVLLALAAVSLVVSSNAASGGTSTLDLTGIITGYHVALDDKPVGTSPGDIGYQTGLVYEHAKRVGRFQGVCTTLPQSSQQCSFTVGLPGGQIVIEAGYGPGFNTGAVALEAVVGGTGVYDGARGQGRDREISNTKLAFHLELVH
ncbi:MAG TPA: hypothetical protein VFA97_06005 [Gaiellaceae bacterium]|nr:hypothetical protein [Gaiellaceae bacterium]